MDDGSDYKGQHTFTCRAQVGKFRDLFEQMAAYPQDYISDHGRLTTNTVEGFHGLALLYRDKRTDLGPHYTCKTNMAICHKVHNTCTYIVLKLLLYWLLSYILTIHRTLVLCGDFSAWLR